MTSEHVYRDWQVEEESMTHAKTIQGKTVKVLRAALLCEPMVLGGYEGDEARKMVDEATTEGDPGGWASDSAEPLATLTYESGIDGEFSNYVMDECQTAHYAAWERINAKLRAAGCYVEDVNAAVALVWPSMEPTLIDTEPSGWGRVGAMPLPPERQAGRVAVTARAVTLPEASVDGHAHLTYYDAEHGLSFVWSGSLEHYVEVSAGGYAEPVAWHEGAFGTKWDEVATLSESVALFGRWCASMAPSIAERLEVTA